MSKGFTTLDKYIYTATIIQRITEKKGQRRERERYREEMVRWVPLY